MTKKLQADKLPKFRYIEDYNKYLEKLDDELDDLANLIKVQQKALASVLTAKPIKATLVFDVTPSDPSDQRKKLQKLKTKIDPELTKVEVPNLKKLQNQYNLAEDLYEKHRTVEAMETQLSLQFPDKRGETFHATMAAMGAMKAKIAGQLKIVLQFLNEVASQHVPKQFVKYVQMVADLVNEHVIFGSSESFMYASVTPLGDLCFTNYLMLVDAVNDEGFVAPHLYISIQWVLGKDSTIHVDLNHEYEPPNKLLGSGDSVGSVGEAVKAISTALELENFSSALGVVPLALQLKVSPEKLTSEMFSYRDLIDRVIVDEDTISFKLRKEADGTELVKAISYQLYKELKELLTSKNVRLTMKLNKVAGSSVVTFNIVRVAQGGELNTYDLEFLRDRFNLSQAQLRKIAQVINQE